MGLYLAIFENDEEIDGVEVGSYRDFGDFRDAVVTHVEDGIAGSVCPTLIRHSDCDGEWTVEQCCRLEVELEMIGRVFAQRPPIALASWKKEVAKTFNIEPRCLADCFFDVDGEPLVQRLFDLARLSRERNLPILFQ